MKLMVGDRAKAGVRVAVGGRIGVGVGVGVMVRGSMCSAACGLTAALPTSPASEREIVRCTCSDGVPSVSSSRCTTCTIFGSSGAMCLASAPM